MKLSFIIPALNEQQSLGETLRSIARFAPSGVDTEVIVADHGSLDQTAAIAVKEGARVLKPRTPTIAGLRNAGARVARGDIFIFLDADVLLTTEWQANAAQLLSGLSRGRGAISGSRVLPPRSTSPIINSWFRPLALAANQSTYINSAHLIVPRDIFETINGFDEELATGEDYDFCRRAVAAGFVIQPERQLMVYHDRYPKCVNDFMRREVWHGQGDAKSLHHVLASKVALASIAFTLLHLFLLLGALMRQPLVVTVAALGVLAILLFIAWKKFGVRQKLTDLCVRLGLAYVYLLARALALVHHSNGWNKPVMARAS